MSTVTSVLQCAALALFVSSPALLAQSTPSSNPCPVWDLAQDFRVVPGQENPNRDSCGNVGVWHLLQSNPATFPAHAPSSYAFLPQYFPNLFSKPGLEQWQGTFVCCGVPQGLPWIGINRTGSLQVIGSGGSVITWPADAVAVHPLSGKFVIVGWRSPWTGTVGVSGGVTDMDPLGTDGIGWSIDHFDGLTNTVVASGVMPNGGSQAFQNGSGGASLANVAVDEGDFLYFLFDPQSDYGCDSTGLEIVITPTSGCSAPSNYCIGAINSKGKSAHIGYQGTTSLAANDLVLTVGGGRPFQTGLFFCALHPTQIPFGEGYLCATGGQRRLLPVLTLDATGATSRALDFSDPLHPEAIIIAGSEWNFQFWYRDPQPVGHGFNLSDALNAVFCP